MKLVIDIPEEQIKKSLKESEYVLEGEGIKGFVNIVMLYTNGRLEFVDIERRENFYSCNFTPLPKGHGKLVDISKIDEDRIESDNPIIYLTMNGQYIEAVSLDYLNNLPPIIEADKESENK